MRANHIHMLKHGQYVQRIEAWADRGAEQKIMYRYPLLDQRIVEFGLSVPAEQFFRSGQGRYMYFQATKNSLPDVIPRRKLPGDSATNSSDRSIRPLVNRSFVTKLIHKEVPRQKLYLLDESRLRQLLESFAQSELWLGFNFAIQCEYIWQYHAEHFQVFY